MKAAPRALEEVRLAVRVTPRGGHDAIEGVRDGVLVIRVAAAPVDGAATGAAIRLVAAALDLPASRVRLVQGAAGRRKVLAVAGLDRAGIVARWPGLGV